MPSDTESLAFVEEGDFPPPPRQATEAPLATRSRPRIMAMPMLHQPSAMPVKVAAAKPPLHNAALSAVAGGPVVHLPPPTAAGKPAKADMSDFSDNESISFAVENGSLSGITTRLATSSMPPSPAMRPSVTSAAPIPLPRRLSRAGSIGSIQFNSEPGSRAASPTPKARLNLRAATPTEKAEVRTPPPSGGRGCSAVDSSIDFFEQVAESPELELSPPIHSQTAKFAAPGKRSSHHSHASLLLPSAAAAAGSAGQNSGSTDDSIAFQIEGDSGMKGSSNTPASPHVQSLAAVSSGSFLARREGRSALAAESGGADFMDSESIAFMVDDNTDERGHQRRPTIAYSVGQGSATPRVAPSRPRSPSIQIDIETVANESVIDNSDSILGDRGGALLFDNKLPVFAQSSTSTTSPTRDAPARSPWANQNSMMSSGRFSAAADPGTATAAAAASATTWQPAKKTVVMNRLQQQHSRLPQPRKKVRTRVPVGVEPSSSHSATQPPPRQSAVVPASLAEQAAEALSASLSGGSKKRRSTSLRDRGFPIKKDARSLVRLRSAHRDTQEEQNRRSKESLASQTTGASPNHRLVTEEGSNGSADSPPEPLCTGHRSQASTDVASSAASPVQEGARALSAFPVQSAAHDSLQGRRGVEDMNRCDRDFHKLNRGMPLLTDGNQTNRSLHDELYAQRQHTEAGSRLGGPTAGAYGEAEQWRQFNQRQREELAELRKRIAMARRQDRTLLEKSSSHETEALVLAPSSRSTVPKPTPMSGRYSRMWPPSQGTVHRPGAHGADGKSGGERRGSSTDTRGTFPHTGSARRPQASVKSTYASTTAAAAAAKQSTHLQQRPGLSVSPTKHSPRPTPYRCRASIGSLAHSSEAGSVADLLGILWPPHTCAATPSQQRSQRADTLLLNADTPAADLYFVNGSRLTPDQVNRFFDLVRVQRDAAPRTLPAAHPFVSVARPSVLTTLRQSTAHSSLAPFAKHDDGPAHLDPAELDTCGDWILRSSSQTRDGRLAPLSTKLAALFPKKTVRRSQVLREVFDAMDLKRQGSIVLRFLPSLARLFEVELATIEHTRESLLHGRAVPLQSLLESAIASRQQCTTSWRGTREHVARGAQKGLDVAQSGALDYPRLIRDAQANLGYLTHRLLLLSFIVNVVIPIAAASRIPLLDFSTLCIIVYAAVDKAEGGADAPQGEWQRVVQQYFTALAA
ncbi:hypothetical protein LSCM1_01366 [Leishmania martiniquensis]|uniref:Uncharacterized protein n=1 Tax=Leishmania martiniquensis TaxID=1580590 RepID=A0A836KFY8_9TRYP|nr:hypothetical protein LSCM1_01366 [Leishmania martiniquensis]